MSTTPSSPPESAVKGFFGALFDFSFKHFVSRRLAGIFYAVGLVIIGISGLVALITTIGSGFITIGTPYSGGTVAGVLIILGGIVAIPIATILAVIILRVWIEAVVALIAVAENTASLRKD